MTGHAPAPPSIARRVARALLGWAVVWGLALALAAWWVVSHEMAEMQDDSLRAAAQAFAGPLSMVPPADAGGAAAAVYSPATAPGPTGAGRHDSNRFVWQRVQQGPVPRVLQSSLGAPGQALLPPAVAGLSDTPLWRVHATPLPTPGQWLLVAQSSRERKEAQREAALAVALVTLPMAVLGLIWLRWQLRRELVPLHTLSRRLATHDPLLPGATLGPVQRRELAAVHEAVDGLSARLAQRVARERAFTAHAAHALRTPLAGMDVQLAMALREAPEPLRPRLQRVRDASGRLQRVLAALLALFRSDQPLQRPQLDLPALAARLPDVGLDVRALAQHPLHADADLLTAALLNLLHNAVRHGARQVTLSTPQPDVLRVCDDGPGVPAARLMALRQSLDQEPAPALITENVDPGTSGGAVAGGGFGLGLRLAELVARAHGGTLQLPDVALGFAVELHLGPSTTAAAPAPTALHPDRAETPTPSP
jgi:signal transduction histidine kinase